MRVTFPGAEAIEEGPPKKDPRGFLEIDLAVLVRGWPEDRGSGDESADLVAVLARRGGENAGLVRGGDGALWRHVQGLADAQIVELLQV